MSHPLYPVRDPASQDWVDSTWSATDNGAGHNHAEPDGTHLAYFVNQSGNVTLTADTLSFADLNMTDFRTDRILDLVGWTVKATGDVILGGYLIGTTGAVLEVGQAFTILGTATFDTRVDILFNGTAGSHTITTNTKILGGIEIDDGGTTLTIVLADDLACGNFTLTDGIFDPAGFAITSSGAFEINGGSLTLGEDQKITGAILIAGGILDLATYKLTMGAGSSLAHTSGSLASSGDWQAKIDAGGATITDVTSMNWIRVTHGHDGGGNTKLFFARAHGPLGRGGITRGLA